MRKISVFLCALIVLLASHSTALAYRTRPLCVKPHLQRSFIIDQPYNVTLGSVIRNGLEMMDESVVITEEGNICLEDIEVSKRSNRKIRKVEIVDQRWDYVELKYSFAESNFSGKAKGGTKLKVADRSIGSLSFWVQQEIEIGDESSRIILTLLNRLSVYGCTIQGYQTEIKLSAHGDKTLVYTRLYLNACVNVPKCCLIRRRVDSIAYGTAHRINCQMQCETEATMRESVNKYKDQVTLIPIVMGVLQQTDKIPEEIKKGIDFKRATIVIKPDEEGNMVPTITAK